MPHKKTVNLRYADYTVVIGLNFKDDETCNKKKLFYQENKDISYYFIPDFLIGAEHTHIIMYNQNSTNDYWNKFLRFE